MISTIEATQTILAAVQPFASEPVPLEQATQRILRQPVVAERDQPPFDRVMMDGIAVSLAALREGPRELPIQAMQAAGDASLTLEDGKAIEIMTGASLPAGADCIVPIERVTIKDRVARIEQDYPAKLHQFIHPRGSDYQQGAELLTPGMRITAMEVAIIASCGLADVTVSRAPRVSVLSTGNELVAAGEAIEPHQIRLSNGPAIVAMLREHGYTDTAHEHLIDELTPLRARIAAHLQASSVLVLSGGVSMGKADFVPEVLAELGVKRHFHKISQRPGKPMWFGIGPKGQAVFALPGNPVSTLVCCRQYVIPALRQMSGQRPPPPQFAALTQAVDSVPQLTHFLPVRLLSNAAGQVLAMPVPTNTSGDFTSLSGTDGYVELAQDQARFKAGAVVPLHRWR